MSNQFEQVKFKQFDQVQLITTKNVKYLSAPSGTTISPKGVWSVVGVVDDELMLAKNNVIIRIPVLDVLKISEYDLSEITQFLGRLLDHGKG